MLATEPHGKHAMGCSVNCVGCCCCSAGGVPTVAFIPTANGPAPSVEGTTVQICPYGTYTEGLGAASFDQCCKSSSHYSRLARFLTVGYCVTAQSGHHTTALALQHSQCGSHHMCSACTSQVYRQQFVRSLAKRTALLARPSKFPATLLLLRNMHVCGLQ